MNFHIKDFLVEDDGKAAPHPSASPQHVTPTAPVAHAPSPSIAVVPSASDASPDATYGF